VDDKATRQVTEPQEQAMLGGEPRRIREAGTTSHGLLELRVTRI
jgi:hypothetical protein